MPPTTTDLKIRKATEADLPAIARVHERMCARLGILLPLPGTGFPVLETLVVEDALGRVRGALHLEVSVEAQASADDPRVMRFLAEQQAEIARHIDASGFGQVTRRAFVLLPLVRKLRHTLKRAGFVPMNDLFATFVHEGRD